VIFFDKGSVGKSGTVGEPGSSVPMPPFTGSCSRSSVAILLSNISPRSPRRRSLTRPAVRGERDFLGQKLTGTDRNGNIHTYSYDVLGRQTADAVATLGPRSMAVCG